MNAQATAPTIAMFAAFALTFFGIRQIFRSTERTRGVLMLVMAVVLLANVVIATM